LNAFSFFLIHEDPRRSFADFSAQPLALRVCGCGTLAADWCFALWAAALAVGKSFSSHPQR
jgi:hypothetical protein